MAVRSLVLGPTDEIEATLSLSVLSRQSKFFKLAEKALLDPLEALGANLNGPVFGFGVPEELGLGTSSCAADSSLVQIMNIDRLVKGETSLLPNYEKAHQDYFNMLVNKAGCVKRLHIQHRLYYAYVKHLWATRHSAAAMDRLSKLNSILELTAHFEKSITSNLQVHCFVKLGNWKLAQEPPGTILSLTKQYEILRAYKKATFRCNNDYKAWHSWALINFRLVQHQKMFQNANDDFRSNDAVLLGPNTGSTTLKQSHAAAATITGPQQQPQSGNKIHHIVAAVHGFVKAISFGVKKWTASVQQDMLNFLTCLFKYGELPEVSRAINDGLGLVHNEAWLGVLPQLLARIHVKSPKIRAILHSLLIKLGVKHPQALMYPLSVLLKSPVDDRRIAAQNLMDALKANSSELVEEAQLVSSELIRVAILWLELWHEGLEESSRLYYHEGNVQGMLDVLLPLHCEVEKGPATNRERNFIESFGSDLANAHAHIKNYIRLISSNGNSIPTQGGFQQSRSSASSSSAPSDVRHGNHGRKINAEAEAAINQAWDLYYNVFRRINKQLPGLTTLELSSCSPALQQASNLVLGIPGTYRVDGSYVKIKRFNPSVQVITSKQRPRKIIIQGNDGNNYVFLLKGHEDLRQDERVMQLFGLVNALLAKDRRTNNHDLKIQRYAIAPLSHNAGVVGWVPHCDTLHILIKEYREAKKIMLNMENRLMTKMAPDYDLLTVLQKVEVFEAALAKTSGKDLYEVLWLKSKDSEEWLERRTRYTRSLAVMSMVGYILGLGDRHPSNLMLDRMSGSLLHIDFGDCFEVAMHREKFPEKVPFRLTRMLIKAMEVSGIEGSYRSTCEQTMGVLRENRDSLVAMLEAFVYDPLISWRLLGEDAAATAPEKAAQPSTTHTEKDKQKKEASDVVIPKEVRQRSLSLSGMDTVKKKSKLRDHFLGTSLVHSRDFMKEVIQEGKDEDGEDEGECIQVVQKNQSSEKNMNKVQLLLSDKEQEDSPDDAREKAAKLNPCTPKGLKIASEIQSMAANISSMGGAKQDSIVGSVARSRIDKSLREKELTSLIDLTGGGEDHANVEALNVRALKVIGRVQDKLTGTDFSSNENSSSMVEPLDVPEQVQRLITQATSNENLCQLFIGWCAFW
uniref:non-specific serine/threonine protein kinase n=1 Tax=Corethron hystrix TaxID=216773 RepID=A0A7S1BDY4_9STRA